MTRTRNVRNATKFKRSIKAISPVIATLLMIAIAVVASLVVYAWVTGYIGGTTSTAGKAIQIQSFASLGGNLVVYVQNVGQGDVELNRDQSIYVNSVLVPITVPADLKIPITQGQTVALQTNTPYTAGTKVNIKVTTTDGTFMTTTGTGTSSGPTTPPGGNAAPIAAFSSVPTGLSVAFTDASTDSDGTVASWSWAFGDGLTSTLQNPTHVYASAKTYTVTLTVTDNDGASSTPAATHDVTVVLGNSAPVLTAIGPKTVDELALLSFTATATDTDVPAQTLTFSLQGVVPSGAAITGAGAFSWTPTEAQGPGSYPITVRVTDNGAGALFDEEVVTVTVNEVAAAPVTITRSPSADSGSSWSNRANAYSDDTSYATCNNDNGAITLSGYGFTIPTGATITQVRIRVDAYVSSNDELRLAISSNGGTSFTTVTVDISPGTSAPGNTYWKDVTSMVSWTPANINSNQIQTRITQIRDGQTDTVYLDWIPIEVTYTP